MEGGFEGEDGHAVIAAHKFGHTGVHVLNGGAARIHAVGGQVDFQAGDRLQIGAKHEVGRAVHHGGACVVVVHHQPALVGSLIDIAPADVAEGEAETGHQSAVILLPEHAPYFRAEAGEHHAVGHRILHREAAHHHQQTARIFGGGFQRTCQRGTAIGDDYELQRHRVLGCNPHFVKVEGLVFNGVCPPVVGSACRDAHLFAEQFVLHDGSAVSVQCYFRFEAGRLFGFPLAGGGVGVGFGAGGGRLGTEFLVYFLEKLAFVVEALEVEVAVEGDLALVLDDVAYLQLGVGGCCSTIPIVGRGVVYGGGCPVQHRDELQGEGKVYLQALVVVHWRTQLADALHDGVFPHLILVGVQLFVHLHVRLFNAGVGAGLEGGVQIVSEVPADAESTIPEEVLTERDGDIVCCTASAAAAHQVSQLHFVVVAHHGGLEGNIGRQVIDAKLLDVFGVSVILLPFGEGLDGFNVGRVGVGKVPAIVFGRFVLGFGIEAVVFAERIADGEVRRVVRHGVLAVDVYFHAVHGKAFGDGLVLCKAADGVFFGSRAGDVHSFG
ncbi:hypothetical protein Barb6_00310 [Bacteroidales bacterium Barb6]|nr:hypothetical protein Barb6_00310 [Bacteroidales bacterium Barb6]